MAACDQPKMGGRCGAAAFDHDDVSPDASERPVGHPPSALAGADDAESGPFMEPKAGVVLGEDRGLDGQNASSLGGFDQGSSSIRPMPVPRARSATYTEMLGDAEVSASVGHRGGDHLAEHPSALDRDVALIR
jgi:hypothetical protein